MVTKPAYNDFVSRVSLILAKIYMVTKHVSMHSYRYSGLILAKIYMVTKQTEAFLATSSRLILAKIYMVTKQEILRII